MNEYAYVGYGWYERNNGNPGKLYFGKRNQLKLRRGRSKCDPYNVLGSRAADFMYPRIDKKTGFVRN